MNQKLLTQLSSTQLFETCKKDGKEISHFNFAYNPETAKLAVFCTYRTKDNYTQQDVVGEFECTANTFNCLLTGIINDPQWITSNTTEPANVFVECGSCR